MIRGIAGKMAGVTIILFLIILLSGFPVASGLTTETTTVGTTAQGTTETTSGTPETSTTRTTTIATTTTTTQGPSETTTGGLQDMSSWYYGGNNQTHNMTILETTETTTPVPTNGTVTPVVMQYFTQTGEQSHIYFQCEFSQPEGINLFYEVSYFVNGDKIHTTGIEQWSSELFKNQQLSESVLRENGITTLGFNIHCTIVLREVQSGPQTELVSSGSKFMGIRIIQDTVSVKSGQSVDVRFESTVSIFCGDGSVTTDENCGVDIFITSMDGEDNSCLPRALLRSCGTQIKKLSWTEQQVINFFGEVIDAYNPWPSRRTFQMRTGETVAHMPIWSNYIIGTIKVEVSKERSVFYGRSYCYAVCDPHMRTFDGRRYEHQCEGDYVMYKHTELSMEVMVRTRLCGGAYCICAVAVRASRTMFRLDYCSTPVNSGPYYFASCDTEGKLLTVINYGNRFKIYLPTGTLVEIYKVWKFLNVYIYPSVMDESKTLGLCGVLNGDRTDDFRRKGQSTSDQENGQRCFREFSRSWRFEYEIDENNLFDDVNLADFPEWKTAERTYCTCQTTSGQELSRTMSCSSSNAKSCIPDRYYTEITDVQGCEVPNKRRRRRQAQEFKCNGACTFIPSRRRKREAFPDGWTEELARQSCIDLFNSVQTVELCEQLEVPGTSLSSNIDTCVLDIQLSGTTNYSISALETYKDSCIRDVQLNSTLQNTTEGETSIADQILAAACPNECTFQGNCIDGTGTCSCHTHYASPDCSIDVRLAPTPYGLKDSGHCDRSQGSCDRISVFLDYVVDTADVSCLLAGFAINSEGAVTAMEQTNVKPEVPFFGEAVCPLPARPSLFADDLAYGYRVAVSNNGQAFSQEDILIVYDKRCVQCTIAGNAVQCQLAKPACMEEGVCYSEGETNPKDVCLSCYIESGDLAGKWKQTKDPSCPPPSSSPMWIAVEKKFYLASLLVAYVCDASITFGMP